jgi:uncharacterized YccA/Bax inhibitor family protein
MPVNRQKATSKWHCYKDMRKDLFKVKSEVITKLAILLIPIFYSPQAAFAASEYRLFTNLTCSTSAEPLSCFTLAVFKFSQTAIIVLAVGAFVAAGVIYMTSAGNPKQIETSKKLMLGALTGVAVMVLGRLFITRVLGVLWPI